ncbi:carbohydrate ABC transporter permease [Herbiconiux sp. VKM Ac-2851]|uniref:carbohydrate ABC transporter permease n=1 Tax=Herbiconiux sp. VKM Ac-2851 TaxID=2739025 RepID=UPI001566B338|nr:sugar ABC transporter permease [Herbiconiux sp. VKM Ac-2851]NQX34753.1 sugar ABC transporter permease [Herbiconiux sp. VKM Ac-2851]
MTTTIIPAGATELAPAGAAPPEPRPRRRRRWNRLALVGLLFVLPAAVYVVIFQLVPVIYGLVLSFTTYSPLSRSGPEFTGVDNYTDLLGDAEFGNALLVTGRYVLQVLPVTVVIALVLALLVNRPFKGVGIFRSALYVPHIVSLTAVSMVWLWMYSQTGLFNEILTGIGLPAQSWLLDSDSALNAVSAMRVWKALGSNMVLLLAGLQSIPKELYEAARVDGAGRWNAFRYVTLPGLRPMLVYVVAMDIIYLAQGFAEIYVLTGGGPLGSTTTVNYLIYNEAFQYNQLGSASAMAFVLFALIVGFSVLAVRGVSGRQK